MNILVVDNGTSYLPQLKNLLFQNSISVIRYDEIDTINMDDFDATILSGGHNFPVYGNEKRLKKEISFVKNSTKPILGICFGFEVIAVAFGAKLKCMKNKEHGILDIQVVEPDGIFSGVPNPRVFENHRWVIDEVTPDLMVLAHSKDGIEAIKHKTRPIYAVQFHPEMFVEKTSGDQIFRNFLNMVA